MTNKIKNFEDLAVNKARETVLKIIEAGLEAIDTNALIKKQIQLEGDTLRIKGREIPLHDINHLYVVGVGKCSSVAASALEEILGDHLTGGIVIDVRLSKKLRKIDGYEGSHPYATPKNINFTKKIINLLQSTERKDLVLMIVSGGGSALLCLPAGALAKDGQLKNSVCDKEQGIIKCLTDGGANIEEINTVRKHLSLARGGFLAKYAHPARVIALILSDVPGDKLEFVASGPAVKDTTSVEDAEAVLEKYSVRARCDFEIDFLIETPKEEKYFERVENILIVNNKIALEAMARKGSELGFSTKIVTAELTGEASEVGVKIAEEIEKAGSKTALLYGGETTVTLRGEGQGGRNQELVLSALRSVGEKQLVAAVSSDGRDNTDFAGAIADTFTEEKAKEKNLDIGKYLSNNDSYNFFRVTGDYILTGDTGSNVSDLIIALKD